MPANSRWDLIQGLKGEGDILIIVFEVKEAQFLILFHC